MVPVASLARFTGNSYGLSDDTVEAAGCTRITNLGTKIVSNFFFSRTRPGACLVKQEANTCTRGAKLSPLSLQQEHQIGTKKQTEDTTKRPSAGQLGTQQDSIALLSEG
jgi:hypothetical protein